MIRAVLLAMLVLAMSAPAADAKPVRKRLKPTEPAALLVQPTKRRVPGGYARIPRGASRPGVREVPRPALRYSPRDLGVARARLRCSERLPTLRPAPRIGLEPTVSFPGSACGF